MNLEAEPKDKHTQVSREIAEFMARPMWIGSIFMEKEKVYEDLIRGNQSVRIINFFLFFF